MDRNDRLFWARELHRNGCLYPAVEVKYQTKFTGVGRRPIVVVKFETIVGVDVCTKSITRNIKKKGYVVVSDFYEFSGISNIHKHCERVQEFTSIFIDKCKTTMEHFVANKSSTEHWFTQKEIEK